jgi:glutamate dehydrogenase (NADP+)
MPFTREPWHTEIINLVKRDVRQKEFVDAVLECLDSVAPLLHAEPRYRNVFKTLVEPDRIIQFKICWLDDDGKWQVNRGFRVQASNAIGVYKGR